MSAALQPQPSAAPEQCAECGRTLDANDRVEAGDKVFCQSCHAKLTMQLRQAVDEMSRDINYPMAAVGAVLGGALGALVWWGFTALTHIAFGLVAVGIGFAVGYGTMILAGGKRSMGLQIMAVLTSAFSFFVASYLVNMTFVNKAFEESGEVMRLGFPPANLEQFVAVIGLDFGIMDIVFLAIVVWQAWSIPKPIKLPEPDAA